MAHVRIPKPACAKCLGSNWVCEEHGIHPSNTSWVGPEACAAGPGIPCLDCCPDGNPPYDWAPDQVLCATPEAWTQILEEQFARTIEGATND